MKTEIEIREKLEEVNKDIADCKKFLKDEVEFEYDEDIVLEDLYLLTEIKKTLEWILNK